MQVLHVEDNESIRRVAVRLLSRLGYFVHGVSAIAEALEYVREGHVPDLVIWDADLIDGCSWQKGVPEMRMLLPDVPMVAASSDPESNRKLVKAGCNEIVGKEIFTFPPEEIRYKFERIGLPVPPSP